MAPRQIWTEWLERVDLADRRRVGSCMTADDERFLAEFESCALPASEWTHAAHIRMAWVHLSHWPFESALDRIRTGILRYNTEILDKRSEYHETVTIASTRIIAKRMQAGESWEEFAARNPDLFKHLRSILLNHYSEQRLLSSAARSSFVAPDLEGLP